MSKIERKRKKLAKTAAQLVEMAVKQGSGKPGYTTVGTGSRRAERKRKKLAKTLEQVEASPAKMVGVNPMTGMPQPNQMTPSPINPTALGGLQNQIPGIVGQTMPGSFDKAMPEGMFRTKEEAIASNTNNAMAKALGY